MEKSFFCATETDTQNLGLRLSKIAQKGDVFALYGTLGMGKSVLSRAFIKSLTSADDVPSPTFTLVQTYEADGFDIYHFDLYRLNDQDEVFELGLEDAIYSGVCLIEWPEKAGNWLPKDIFSIQITPEKDGRTIKIVAGSEEKSKRLEAV